MVNIPEWFTSSDINFCPCGRPLDPSGMVLIEDGEGDRYLMHPECAEGLMGWNEDDEEY